MGEAAKQFRFSKQQETRKPLQNGLFGNSNLMSSCQSAYYYFAQCDLNDCDFVLLQSFILVIAK